MTDTETETEIEIERAAQDGYDSFARREPVVLAHLLTAPLAGLGSFLVTHGVLTATQASQATQWTLTTAATVAVAAQGLVLRRFVAPRWKLLEQAGLLDGELGDVGFEAPDPPPDAPLPPGDPAAGEPAGPTSKPDLPAAPPT